MTGTSDDSGDGHRVRRATPADGLEVRRLLDAALLAVDGLDERLAAGDVLLAVEPRSESSTGDTDASEGVAGASGDEASAGGDTGASEGETEPSGNEAAASGDETGARGEDADASDECTPDRALGVIVLEPQSRGEHVVAIAVHRSRRDRGIGRALVDAALDRERRLTARFDERVRPFYESLGFEIEPIDGDRYGGVLGEPTDQSSSPTASSAPEASSEEP